MDLDYLDPLLGEIQPPVITPYSITTDLDSQTAKRWNVEFHTASSILFQNYVEKSYMNSGFDSAFAHSRYRHLLVTFVFLNAFGYEEISTDIFQNLVVNPQRSFDLLLKSKEFIINPLTDYSWNDSMLQEK